MIKRLVLMAVFVFLMVLVAGCNASGGETNDAVAAGEELFNQTVIGENAGCITCHSLEPDVVIVGPSLAAFAHEAEEEGEDLGMTAEAFIRESILEPQAKIRDGFQPVMPTFKGMLDDDKIRFLIEYIKTLK